MDFDFSKIRIYDGSQEKGFEELVCQLAQLQKPDNADFFVRKEGAGGDAGVECFWKLKDGTENAWQAKYFLREMNSSRWDQISESIETTLQKHPAITIYYVALPLDRTDSRKTGRGGKQVVSIYDEWCLHVENWKKLATDKGMQVKFEFWGKHEICQMLQTDNPHYTGRALYWFNEPILGLEHFTRIAEQSKRVLGERYTPESHLDLPIANTFDGIGLTPNWWPKLESVIDSWVKSKNKLETDCFYLEEYITRNEWMALEKHIETFYDQFCIGLKEKRFLDILEQSKITANKLIEKTQACLEILPHQSKATDKEKNCRRVLYDFHSEMDKILSFLSGKNVSAAVSRTALLHGDAGIGKSHLLCDITLQRLQQNLPTVFLLGQHYTGGNPLDFLLESLDLKGLRYQQVLGALDAAGEAKATNTLIIIDAINEGVGRDDWYDQLARFATEVSDYSHLSLVLSCRSTYLNYMIPADLGADRLVRIEHHGFRGYEHRGAAKYLSQQGIAKPSVPITAPEFSNPLFVKTCCKALKARGETAFPKGLQGIDTLFDFYVESIEYNISLKKRYRPGEIVVRDVLLQFASHLYPNHLFGIPLREARELINAIDPNPLVGAGLLDELIHEGVLAEDILPAKENGKRGQPVVRFTYERFSDYFVAKQLIEQHVTDGDIQSAFKTGQPLGNLFCETYKYGLDGILEAMAICIAEQYHAELIDLVPKQARKENNWLFEQLFTQTLLRRSAASFTERTIDLLNRISEYGHHSTRLDILLSLSTEPGHPWNADFLHKNLVRRSLPERDAFWSIHLAVSDFEEDENEPESIVRTLIDWAQFGNFDDIEPERLRLAAVTLLWFTTSTNRKVRDQATKSLVRTLSLCPVYLPQLIEEFHDIDDLYLLERLYAVAFGVASNIQGSKNVTEIAQKVYDKVFSLGQPIPHILLRDYARSTLEYALNRNLLPPDINPQSFRSPYKSDWPIEIPTQAELEKLEGDEYSSDIKSSLMGFPGDFGNYTMGCVNYWSLTSLSEPAPETWYELQVRFAQSLRDDLKERYLDYLNEINDADEQEEFDLAALLNELEEFDNEEDLEQIAEEEEEEPDTEESSWDALKKEIEASLDAERLEYFRWISGIPGDKNPALFNKKWAQRWACKRAYELGWKKELFEDFESHCSRGRGRGSNLMERTGKKYQWIAFYQLLAHLADNLHWIDRGYSDVDDSRYFGPWQSWNRDIDPSHWLRKTERKNESRQWWQPYQFPFAEDNFDEQLKWMWSEDIIPPFEQLLQVISPQDGLHWTVLHGFGNQSKRSLIGNDNEISRQTGWFRINSIIIAKKNCKQIIKATAGQNLCDPYLTGISTTGHQAFLREYPWHESCQDMTEWRESSRFEKIIPMKYLVPIAKYEWETGNEDYSITDNISFYLPSKTLIRDLGLSAAPGEKVGQWMDTNNHLAFFDPSISEQGSSYALIRTELLLPWLEEQELQLVWLVGGEKYLIPNKSTNFSGRLVFSGAYLMTEHGPKGNLWFIKEEPRVR
jgi:hypothetical protein